MRDLYMLYMLFMLIQQFGLGTFFAFIQSEMPWGHHRPVGYLHGDFTSPLDLPLPIHLHNFTMIYHRSSTIYFLLCSFISWDTLLYKIYGDVIFQKNLRSEKIFFFKNFFFHCQFNRLIFKLIRTFVRVYACAGVYEWYKIYIFITFEVFIQFH